MKLFALYIGGRHSRANIELHDMRFIAAPSLRETYEELRKQWWGTPASLHLDGWAELVHVDGYDVELKTEPFVGAEKLYYVNLGGYEESEFIEKHQNVFVVAASLAEAKKRALRANQGLKQLHRDDLYEAEQAYCLSDGLEEQRLHIHLTPSPHARPVAFDCGYLPLKKRSAS